ncbi:MAG: hypothetical protein WCF26_28975 [Candidatus Sulfotelmatobacter sp.]
MSLKLWFRDVAAAVLSLALSTTIAVAQDHDHGHDRDIHDWYRAHYSHLPPGLAKRDRLPPGEAFEF